MIYMNKNTKYGYVAVNQILIGEYTGEFIENAGNSGFLQPDLNTAHLNGIAKKNLL